MNNYYGRQIVNPKIASVPAGIIVRPAFISGICQRCGQQQLAPLPNQQFYCLACLSLGRVSSLDVLWSLPEPNAFAHHEKTLTWQGTLTAQQRLVSQALIDTLGALQEHLVWAVTGAGKTEMMFPVISHALQAKQRVAILSPRVDVIVELAPRIATAFNTTPITVLYGTQEENYRYTALVLATTHQMLRFKSAFDLLIIDEVDSFPYVNNAMLAYAVKQAKKAESTVIYLTATPTKIMKKRAERREINVSYLPLRFHQQPLPTLNVSLVGRWRKKLPQKLLRQLRQFQKRMQRFLIFVPRVADTLVIYRKISQRFPDMLGDFVHAGDVSRQQKVQNMRDEKIQYLVTTTILERGVTFPGIDVLILGAEEETFSENALVQIAGRVGRDNKRPTGLVRAYVQHINLKVLAAKRQIKLMNRRGATLGGKR